MTNKEDKQLYTIPKAAKLAGVNERVLRRAVTDKKVKSVPIEGVKGIEMRAVRLTDVEQWRDDPEAHKRGRKKVTTS